ncbi:MAG: hypothetical protein IKM46_03770 [Clostridia bacterium]|nr:hypothetical protein [Clostridia bacterium]
MIKRTISVLLVILIVSGMLVSCGDNSKPAETVHVSVDNSSSADDALESEIDSYIAELSSEHNFTGKRFTWIGEGVEAPKVEEETGDVQSDALYNRQRTIEELFGIDWVNYIPEGVEGSYNCGTVDAVIEDVMAGTGTFNAGYGMENPITQPLLTQNVLADLSTLSYVDFERPWWPASLLESYTIGSALYLLNGPIVTFYYQDAACVIYSKSVAEDYNIPDLYSIVKSGEWTFDKMFEIAEAVPLNQNGTGAYRYGEPEGVGILIAHGMEVVKFDSLGKPYVEESLTKELSDLSDKFAPIFSDDNQTVHCKVMSVTGSEKWESKYGYDTCDSMFADNRILFMFIPIDEAAWLRIEEVEFGILPMPKGSAEQENYISYADRASTHEVFVPKSCADFEMTDVILEAMAALGRKYFKPVFYDNILKSRSTYDNQSKEMVDIIFETKKYDMVALLDKSGSINGDGSYTTLVSASVVETNVGLASKFKMQGRTMNKHIKELLESIE